jgi:hypothetical protein
MAARASERQRRSISAVSLVTYTPPVVNTELTHSVPRINKNLAYTGIQSIRHNALAMIGIDLPMTIKHQ